MELPILYQRDSKGKVRTWRVSTEGHTIIVEHGILGGKIQRKLTPAKPKNVGKANATTAEEQAILEAKSKWTAQVERDDYAEDVEQAGLQTRPMLANDYHKVGHRVQWDLGTVDQPKLDGLRLAAGYRWNDRRHEFEMLTRKGETHNVSHLVKPAAELLTVANELAKNLGCGVEDPFVAVDGEVYLHGKTLQWITSRSKKYYKGETEQLEYHVFDLVTREPIQFWARYEVLKLAFHKLQAMGVQANLVLVPCMDVFNEDELLLHHGGYVEAGYEGAILRHKAGHYKMGTGGTRSADLFKYKVFEEEECLITGIWEDDNGNAMWTCRRKPTLDFGANVVVDVTPKRSHPERKQMLLEPEKWVGQWVTVRYQAVTEKGSLQFPTGRDLRECDELGEPIR